MAEDQAKVQHDASGQILWFAEIGIGDIGKVGGKNASLGEMIRHLAPAGIAIPNGFATTAQAYRGFLAERGLDRALGELLRDLDIEDVERLQDCGRKARSLILSAPFTPQLTEAILNAYRRLSESSGGECDVAVRSSATAEDLPEASFAGQQETYLNVRGEAALLNACHRCFASLFTDRAIHYRQTRGYDHLAVALSIGVQQMVRSDEACSGVMFSIDTETGFPGVVLINSSYGLGESIVQGTVNPDEFLVFKGTLGQGKAPILRRKIGSKETKLIYDTGGEKMTRMVPVPVPERQKLTLEDAEILQLARWACVIEAHYSQVKGAACPMDMEWAKDGRSGKLFILQARPETGRSAQKAFALRSYRLQSRSEVLAKGRAVGEAIAAGRARVISGPEGMSAFQAGEVLVTEKTDPDWEPILKKAAAVLTDQGGRTCHAAIVARELGIPAIVGCQTATAVLRTGQELTVSCAEGDEGRVYAGILPYEVEERQAGDWPKLRTELMLNLAQPAEAFRLAALPNEGIGLARMEFIIASEIQVHPMALVHWSALPDSGAKDKIAELTAGYADKTEYFVEKLAEGIGTIAAAFYPKPVIVRLSDFKTNEYAKLLGGEQFEPPEENPMIGWRGASRYYDEKYRDGFALECRALKRVRNDMGLTNLVVMVPFCRTPAEGRAVLAEMGKHGLVRGENGLQVYVMCEIPSNAILADEFSQVFDGFSIGSNDLTQLVLGIDRDSTLVARLFDERDPAVLNTIRNVIAAAKRNGRKIGICGQAPSDYPDFAKFLVEQGIDSISLNPDSLLKVRQIIAAAEGLQQRDNGSNV